MGMLAWPLHLVVAHTGQPTTIQGTPWCGCINPGHLLRAAIMRDRRSSAIMRSMAVRWGRGHAQHSVCDRDRAADAILS